MGLIFRSKNLCPFGIKTFQYENGLGIPYVEIKLSKPVSIFI